MRTLTAEPLTREAFAPFGDVIAADETAESFPINNGTTQRFHDLAAVQLGGDAPRALISIFRGQSFSPPLTVSMLERHPLGSQAFVPLNGRPYLVVVAPPGEQVDPATVRAFLARGDQGVNYHAGVWHHPLLALESTSDFLVVDRGGPGDNCDELTLAQPLQLTA
ncbi:Ureidoglycolate lyase [wastewater metagenome]|uniref:Ureidoglycolate lyase n=2 Tax=unclassified sequences TaxID=12908 RepID=A0A5B8RD36_9ZZZZ|nr:MULTISPECIES: ureidoglycolate lyase [Arhodomonas]MCS4505064.1 ureidoglycolate lyase [Arhodomonas aquaeolei]QEA05858.1 ureidoglycolate lyase [uncultured organism]